MKKPLISNCVVEEFWSGCCFKGTKGCRVEHPDCQNINIGDLIVGYHEGYFIATRFFFDEFGKKGITRVEMVKVLNSNGTKSAKITRVCDIEYCQRVDKNGVDNLCFSVLNGLINLRNNLLEYC